MSTSAHHDLPLLSFAQAGKEVTHNEAIVVIDAVLNRRILDRDVSDPSTLTPSDGDAYIPKATAVGAWAGHEDDVAVYYNGTWFFATPKKGWAYYVVDEQQLVMFDGAAWATYTEFAFLNGDADLYFGGAASMGLGDKDWRGVGLEPGAKLELYRSAADAVLLVHAASPASEVAKLWLRTGTKDYELKNDGSVLKVLGEGATLATIDENAGRVTLDTLLLRLDERTAPPASPQARDVVAADGTLWDPAAKGSGPYPVFYDGAAWQDMIAGAGGGLSNAYASITDGTTTATASGGDTFKLRSANNRLTITVANDDATHGDNALLTVNEANIDHDALANFVANEHVDHSAVSISAGTGLSGGGDITATRTLSLDIAGLTALTVPATGDAVPIEDVSVPGRRKITLADLLKVINALTADATPDGAADYVVTYDASASAAKKVLLNDLPGAGGGLTDAYGSITDGTNTATASGSDTFKMRSADGRLTVVVANDDATHGDNVLLTVVDAAIDHDALANFVADEHVAHSGVTITAGAGLSGGGDITASRTLAVDVNGQTDLAAPATDDQLLISDTSATHAVKKADVASIVNLADHDALANFVANEHVDHSAVSISAGTGLSGGGDLTATRTLALDIAGLTALTAPATGDALAIEDVSVPGRRKITLAGVLKVINVLTADATPDGAADKVVTYDASAGAAKSVLLDNLPYLRANKAEASTKQKWFGTATLTDGANISWNLDDAQVAVVTLGGNRTLDNPTNMKDGATYVLIVKQDATGGRTLSYGTAYKWPGGTAPTLSTGSNAVDVITFVSDGTSMYGVFQGNFS